MAKRKELPTDLKADADEITKSQHQKKELPKWVYTKDDKIQTSPSLLGDFILSENDYIYVQVQDDISLWQYSKEFGYWQRINKQSIRYTVTQHLKSISAWKAKTASDTEKYILNSVEIKQAKDTIEKVQPELIHFKNGTYNIETDKLEPNKLGNWFFGGRDYELDMTGTGTPLTDSWIKESARDADDYLKEYIGYAFYRSYKPFQKFTVLLSEGGTGKSVFFNWFNQVVGSQNVSNVSLQDITDPKKQFVMSELHNMNANYYADISSGIIVDPSLVKGATGDDIITTNEKFKNGVSTQMYAKLFFGANNLPAFKDSSYGFERRPEIVEFHNIPDFNSRFEMKEIYKEIPSFTYKCLKAFKHAMDTGKLSETKQMESDRDEWLGANNHVKEFVSDYCNTGETIYEKKVYVYDAYRQFCFSNGYKAMSNQKLKSELERLNINEERKYFKDERVRVYTGIKVKSSVLEPNLQLVK